MALLLKNKIDFIAFDFETANSDTGSICQIGIATVCNKSVHKVYSELINPEVKFDQVNMSIHGITQEDVKHAPTFAEIMPQFENLFRNEISVSHSSFDKTAIEKACKSAEIENPLNTWLDSMLVARNAWPDRFGKSGYGLRNIADTFGIEFGHHDAGEDAKAAAEIMLRAVSDTEKDIQGWLNFADRKARASKTHASNNIATEGNPEGKYVGDRAVFTGEITLSRVDAAKLAAKVGITVDAGVTKKTTLLVVGIQDMSLLAGHKKSGKHRKAETYISNGQNIRIITEREFLLMVDQA